MSGSLANGVPLRANDDSERDLSRDVLAQVSAPES